VLDILTGVLLKADDLDVVHLGHADSAAGQLLKKVWAS
jgi:hypothetical protein